MEPANPQLEKSGWFTKHKLLGYLFLVLVFAGAVALAYWWQYGSRTTITINDNDNKTADWKTYRNEEYGFEFGYPSDWQILSGTAKGWVAVGPIDRESSWHPVGEGRSKDLEFGSQVLSEYLEENDYYNKNPRSLLDYLEFYGSYTFGSDPDIVDNFEETSFLGQKAYLVSEGGMSGGYNIVFEKYTRVYTVELPYNADPSAENFGLEEQQYSVLSSFKLLEPKTENWKTYTNEKYGFEIRLPEYWEGYKTSLRQLSYSGIAVSFDFPYTFYGTKTYYQGAFQILIYPAETWPSVQFYPDGSKPRKLRETDTYVYAYAFGQDFGGNIELDRAAKDMMKIIETFELIQ
ncbi:MAG: hypothetical protein HY395_02735 [Candidatus Doudnabacteria bacterium]|nr:hypothetical protein [Candidatus Doudnabacteria bacterium]